jgi:hypothetical protein
MYRNFLTVAAVVVLLVVGVFSFSSSIVIQQALGQNSTTSRVKDAYNLCLSRVTGVGFSEQLARPFCIDQIKNGASGQVGNMQTNNKENDNDDNDDDKGWD